MALRASFAAILLLGSSVSAVSAAEAPAPMAAAPAEDPTLPRFEPSQAEFVEAYDAFAGLREFYFRYPDIILVDALLPLMSGLELCRVVKSHPERRSIPVVILSAAAQENEIRSGYQVGADGYLVKPFRSQDLLDAIARLSAGR
jgi:CheY-like chemotaxis protein